MKVYLKILYMIALSVTNLAKWHISKIYAYKYYTWSNFHNVLCLSIYALTLHFNCLDFGTVAELYHVSFAAE